MKCDINKTSRDYTILLNNEKIKTPMNLTPLNDCIQNSIEYKLKILAQKNEVSYTKNEQKDDLTFHSMNVNTLAIYTQNFYYVIFKLSLFIILFRSYFLLSK